ncbi:reverse transcriptase domain-containing protein [Tanacetum coccineum]
MFEYVLLMKIKLFIKKLEDLEVTAAGYISTTGEVQSKYSKSLLLLVLVTIARRVSAVRVLKTKHRSSGSTTLERSKVLENKHHPDKPKTNAYFPLLPPCFKPTQPLTRDTHEPLEKDPNDFNLSVPNSHHEDEDVDEWLNAEMSKHITEQDKDEKEDALIDILKTVVEECKSIYKKAQIKAPSSRTSKLQGISFITEKEEEDNSETLPCQLPPKEMNPGSFTLPYTIGNLKLYAMTDLGAGVNVMPKSLFEHLELADLKETSMVVEMADMTKKALLGIVENILVKIDKFLFHFDFVVIDMLDGLNETMLLGTPSCSNESIDTVDSIDDMQELEGSQDDEVGIHLLENVVLRWHV